MEKRRKNAVILSTIGVVMLLIGVSYSFFNYTRTGISNTIRVGRIAFNSNQTNTITLLDVFPIDSADVDTSTDVGTATIAITGDTEYTEGVEYQLTVTGLSNTINNKAIPIDVVVTATGLGTADADYFTNRGPSASTSIYKVLADGTISNNGQLLVGYIKEGLTGVNGTVTIKAYLDKEKVAISDTYYENATTTPTPTAPNDMYGTTTEWAGDRVVLTTNEWNLLSNTGISFQVKVEANEGVWVEEPLTGVQKVQRAITAKVNAQSNACNPVWVDDNETANDTSDDITYFSGTNDCVDMNYVWYSGKLWRITAIYPDGAMKLVTQNNITSIEYNGSGQANFYTDANTTSYMYKWLNEEFYDTLYHARNIIETNKKWNETMPGDTTISTKPLETNMVTSNIGLLNNYEYYNSYRCIGSVACTGSSYSAGYLNIGYAWILLNPYNSSNIWTVYSTGNCTSGGTYTYGTRPSIYIKSNLKFIGDGTNFNPYKIVGDKDIGQKNELINTRLSGEYVKLDNGTTSQLFRIIGIEDNKTKIIAMDYADNKNIRKFATSTGSANALWGSGTTTDTNTWYTYLNTTTTGYFDTLKSMYGELFDNGLYYLGTSGYNYKFSVCANTTSGNTKVCDKTGDKATFNIGLPRYGEMFATQQGTGQSNNSIAMWLINRSSGWKIWYMRKDGTGQNDNMTSEYAVRPTLHLKSTVKILSGSGTETDPYVVGL